jgi:hypothetical protein
MNASLENDVHRGASSIRRAFVKCPRVNMGSFRRAALSEPPFRCDLSLRDDGRPFEQIGKLCAAGQFVVGWLRGRERKAATRKTTARRFRLLNI